MGFVCDLELVSLTSGNGSYVAGAGDQLRTDERLCGRAPSAERPPRSRSAHQSVRARSATRTSVPRVNYETNYIETFESNGLCPLSTHYCQVTALRPVSSSVFAFGTSFLAFLLFMFTTVGVLFTCHSLDLPQLKVFEEHVLYTACAGLNNCLHSSCIDFDMLRYLCVFIYSVSVVMFNSSVCCIRVIIEVSSVSRMRLNLLLDVTLRKKFSREVFTHCYEKP